MKTPTKPPVKPVKKDSGLGLLCFLLLLGATFAVKELFIVDNDIEIRTKFSGQSWQLNQQMLRKYWHDSQQIVGGWLAPLGANVGRESQQMLDRASAALSSPQNFCIPTDRVANTWQRLNPLATETETEDEREKSHPNVKSQPMPAPTPANWCVTTRIKK